MFPDNKILQYAVIVKPEHIGIYTIIYAPSLSYNQLGIFYDHLVTKGSFFTKCDKVCVISEYLEKTALTQTTNAISLFPET